MYLWSSNPGENTCDDDELTNGVHMFVKVQCLILYVPTTVGDQDNQAICMHTSMHAAYNHQWYFSHEFTHFVLQN